MTVGTVRNGCTFLAGHRVGGRVVEFPHLCPGVGCAVARWIGDNALRDDVEAVYPLPAADERIVQETSHS